MADWVPQDECWLINFFGAIKKYHFDYLELVDHKEGIEEDVRYIITADFLKGIRASGVLFDRIIPIKSKSKLYRTIIRPARWFWMLNNEKTVCQ